MTGFNRNIPKMKVGVVLSDKMQKTRVIGVERRVKHTFYGKYMTRTTRLMAHDQEEQSHVGDIVRIAETRPLSRNKRWRLVEIVKRIGAQEEAS